MSWEHLIEIGRPDGNDDNENLSTAFIKMIHQGDVFKLKTYTLPDIARSTLTIGASIKNLIENRGGSYTSGNPPREEPGRTWGLKFGNLINSLVDSRNPEFALLDFLATLAPSLEIRHDDVVKILRNMFDTGDLSLIDVHESKRRFNEAAQSLHLPPVFPDFKL